MTARRCPGCRQPVTSGRLACGPCEARLPDGLYQQLRDAAAALVRVERATQRWLQTHPRVTPRELEAVRLLAQGLGSAAVAARMGVTSATAKSMLDEVARRWQVRSRAQLVAHAYELGYLCVTAAASVPAADTTVHASGRGGVPVVAVPAMRRSA